MTGHPERAEAFVADAERTGWHDQALWFVRARRDRASHAVPEWEALREAAAAIKAHTISQLDLYLERFEHQAIQAGAHVHWARDAAELREVVTELLESRGARRVVKSKSMLTEECGLNPHLEAAGIEVVDTDLGERIVQLRDEPPSHIVLPAIHLRRGDVGETFHEALGTPAGEDDPAVLTEAARQALRARFLEADAGITGVNFAVAETGAIVVCTNEGNADLGTVLPPLHIACVGIEKLVPRTADLGVFLRLLARSATGQAITAYTSQFRGPREGGEQHIVVVDNGRSRLLADPTLRSALRCIRCGACLNTCPVYRRSGGHSYGSVVPGPIGSVLEPARALESHASLPSACSLCGSCADVCPVKIPLPDQLLALRAAAVERGFAPWRKRALLRFAGPVLAHPRLMSAAGTLARGVLRAFPGWLLRRTAWGRSREFPELPRESFRSALRRQKRGE